MALNKLDELKELLDSLPNNVDTWNENRFSMSEETLEENLWSICDAFERTSSIESFIQNLNFDIDVKYPLLAKLGELLHLLNCYCQSYEENLLLLPDRIPERCHNTLYDMKASDKPGRPNILVNEEQIIGLRSLNMSWKKIAELIGISERTLRTKRQSFRDQNSVSYSQVNDEQLDSFLRDIVKNHPNAGERMIQGHLISLGCKVQRWRVRASLKRVDVIESSACSIFASEEEFTMFPVPMLYGKNIFLYSLGLAN